MAFRFDAFGNYNEYDKSLTNLKKEEFSSSSTGETPDPEETNHIVKEFNLKTEEELTDFYNLTGVWF